jgi:hypothetical protein
VEKTLREKPPAATQWSTRTMARAVGLSHTSVKRIWNAHELKPHLSRGFKLSNDKRFVEKVQDVVGLYLCPPDRALVLSVDEKSQVQALDRTQPGLRTERFANEDHRQSRMDGSRWPEQRSRQPTTDPQIKEVSCAEQCRHRDLSRPDHGD